MSVWKKASKSHQKTHRERHQPETRAHLGLLEKRKDYRLRASDHNDKQSTLKLLRKRALNRNPDEFYHHMINSETKHGKHFEKQPKRDSEHSSEQLQLMRSQDLKYVTTKRTQERKKIEKLQAQLHMCNVDYKFKNKHKYFDENLDESYEGDAVSEWLSKEELPDVDLDALSEAVKNRKGLYNQLAKRIRRERELAVVARKLEMKRCVEGKRGLLKPKRVQKATKDSAPVYVWKYERKK